MTLVEALAGSVERYADRPAFVFREQVLSYADLDRQSAALAQHLINRGLNPGDKVAIFLGKSLQSATSVYGVLRSGGAFVPFDPQLPQDRVEFMLRDCGIRYVITDQKGLRCLEKLPVELTGQIHVVGVSESPVMLSTSDWEEATAPGSQELPCISADDVAYIMYTSGSTGHPKGLVHTHASAMAYAIASAEEFDVTSQDRISGFPPLHFDQSTFHFFSGPGRGAATVLVAEEFGSFPADLSALIEQEQITIWYSVPYVLMLLATRGVLEERDLSCVRWVKFGGEAFAPKHLRTLMQHMPAAQFANIYGPAEVNQCTHYVLPAAPGSDEPVPIGKPWPVASLKVLDDCDNAVVTGEAGELVVATTTMMSGYWGRDDLNEKSFVSIPAEGGTRYYRTGDQVRERRDGNYEFLGRMDRQVKVRGYRIELDELEAALMELPQVREAAVYPVRLPDGADTLAASLIAEPEQELARGTVLGHMARRVPRYAVPTQITITDRFPRTGSGKIDRKLLTQNAEQELSNKESAR